MFGVEGFREFADLYKSWAQRLPYERLHILSAGLSVFMIKTFCVCYDVSDRYEGHGSLRMESENYSKH